MNYSAFRQLVQDMREAQCRFARTQSIKVLAVATALERQVDAVISGEAFDGDGDHPELFSED